MTETINNKKIYSGLDIAKFLCALLILFYHFFTEHPMLPTLLEEALSAYAIAVALFMTISGFLAFDKIGSLASTMERWCVVKKQVFRILRIYAIWSVIYIIYNIYHWQWETISFNYIFWQVQSWLFNSTFYTIWFMPSLAIGLILTFWFTEKLPKTIVYVLAMTLFTVGAFSSTYSFIGEHIPSFGVLNNFLKTWLGGSRGWLVFAFPFILLGKTMVQVKDRINLVVAIVGVVVGLSLLLIEALLLRHFVGHTGVDNAFFMIPTVFFVLALLLKINLNIGCVGIWMRQMSILIFMSQRLFLTVLPNVFENYYNTYIFSNRLLSFVFVCVITIIFSESIILLSKKVKSFKLMY